MTAEDENQPVTIDRDYIEHNHIIEEYLAGRLSPAETEVFEISLLENPDILDAIMFVIGLRAIKDEYSTDESTATRSESSIRNSRTKK